MPAPVVACSTAGAGLDKAVRSRGRFDADPNWGAFLRTAVIGDAGAVRARRGGLGCSLSDSRSDSLSQDDDVAMLVTWDTEEGARVKGDGDGGGSRGGGGRRLL